MNYFLLIIIVVLLSFPLSAHKAYFVLTLKDCSIDCPQLKYIDSVRQLHQTKIIFRSSLRNDSLSISKKVPVEVLFSDSLLLKYSDGETSRVILADEFNDEISNIPLSAIEKNFNKLFGNNTTKESIILPPKLKVSNAREIEADQRFFYFLHPFINSVAIINRQDPDKYYSFELNDGLINRIKDRISAFYEPQVTEFALSLGTTRFRSIHLNNGKLYVGLAMKVPTKDKLYNEYNFIVTVEQVNGKFEVKELRYINDFEESYKVDLAKGFMVGDDGTVLASVYNRGQANKFFFLGEYKPKQNDLVLVKYLDQELPEYFIEQGVAGNLTEKLFTGSKVYFRMSPNFLDLSNEKMYELPFLTKHFSFRRPIKEFHKVYYYLYAAKESNGNTQLLIYQNNSFSLYILDKNYNVKDKINLNGVVPKDYISLATFLDTDKIALIKNEPFSIDIFTIDLDKY